jgi:predicted regulator of Ras-like GTPase activity (Roadblock/LC7/MglB family)
MIERLLAGVVSQRGITDAWLVEKDGFVLYSKQSASHAVQDWLALARNASEVQTVTLVQEQGFVLLRTLQIGVLILKAQRETNLGSLRIALNKLSADEANMDA